TPPAGRRAGGSTAGSRPPSGDRSGSPRGGPAPAGDGVAPRSPGQGGAGARGRYWSSFSPSNRTLAEDQYRVIVRPDHATEVPTMLPTSRWMLDLDQATPFDLDRPERLDRMERVPLWARPRRPDPAPRSLVRMADRLRERISSWA